MPLMQGRVVALAAGQNSGNVLAGKLEEILKRPSAIRLAAVTNAAPTTNAVQATLLIGDKILMHGQDVLAAALAGRVIIPDDVLVQHGGPAGARLTLSFQNADTVAATIIWRVDVVPMG